MGNDQGEVLASRLRAGQVDARRPAAQMARGSIGNRCGDTGALQPLVEALLASASTKGWSVTTDQATAQRLQAAYPVSTMVNQAGGVMLRLISVTRTLEAAVVVDPSLEDAYLLATGQHAVPV